MARYVVPTTTIAGPSAIQMDYIVGDRTSVVTATSAGITFNSGPLSDVLEEGANTWVNTVNPISGLQVMTFAFDDTVTLQYFTWEQSTTAAFGVWDVAVLRSGVWQDLASTGTLGGATLVQIDIDEALQSTVDGIRFTGSSGLMSNGPYIIEARFYCVI